MQETKDSSSVPGSGRPPGGGNGNPFQCSYLENPMDRGAWWATVHEMAKSQMRLSSISCKWFNSCSRTDLYPGITRRADTWILLQELVISLACALCICSFKMSSGVPWNMPPRLRATSLEREWWISRERVLIPDAGEPCVTLSTPAWEILRDCPEKAAEPKGPWGLAQVMMLRSSKKSILTKENSKCHKKVP